MNAANTALDESFADEPERLSPRDFERLARFIKDYSGIKMPPTKATMVELRLRRRLRATGIATLQEYCRYLFDRNGLEAEAVFLIDAVTTNKTDFFREPDHFTFLAEFILPEIAAARPAGSPPVKIWSAACSTGAEPYTIAMVADDFARQNSALRYSILATDICTEVLNVAFQGIYPEAMLAPVPGSLLQRYVRRGKNRSRGVMRIAPELRSQVRFARINLMEAPYPADRDFDVIFCRNILIYFDKPTQDAVLQHLCGHLRPGGYLILGHSETLAGFNLPLKTVGPTIFRMQ